MLHVAVDEHIGRSARVIFARHPATTVANDGLSLTLLAQNTRRLDDDFVPHHPFVQVSGSLSWRAATVAIVLPWHGRDDEVGSIRGL